MSKLPESRKRKLSAKAINNPELPKRKKTPTPTSRRPQASHHPSKAPNPTVEESLDDDDRVAHQQSRGGSPSRPESVLEAIDSEDDIEEHEKRTGEEEEDGEPKETSEGGKNRREEETDEEELG